MSHAAVSSEDAGRTTPPVPFFVLNGLDVLEVGAAGAVCSTEVRPWLEGTAELGIQAATVALADCALNYAAAHRSSGDLFPVSLGLRLDFWCPPPVLGSRLSGIASVEAVSGDAFLIRGQINGPEAVLATATLRSLLVSKSAPSGPSGRWDASRVALVPPPDDASSGLTPTLDAVLSLSAARLAALDVLRTATGMVELAARPDATLERTEGVVHGGAVPVLGQLGCAAALALAIPESPSPRRLDTTTEFLRPTFVGAALTIRARLVHRSRRIVATQAEILNDEGKPTARVYETALLEPG
jgi:acyl-coenzyme A thioesterase PaaI-like protein